MLLKLYEPNEWEARDGLWQVHKRIANCFASNSSFLPAYNKKINKYPRNSKVDFCIKKNIGFIMHNERFKKMLHKLIK